MAKVQTDRGSSIATTYDTVKGVLVDEYRNEEGITPVEDIFRRIQAERAATDVRTVNLILAQSSADSTTLTLGNFHPFVFVIESIAITAEAGEWDQVSVELGSDTAGSGQQILVSYDSANDVENGRPDTTNVILIPGLALAQPVLCRGSLAETDGMPIYSTLTIRGSTLAFGAGNATLAVRVKVRYSQTGGSNLGSLRSRGFFPLL
jgi:hypothetical protein